MLHVNSDNDREAFASDILEAQHMSPTPTGDVVLTDSPREAALYFDHVVTLPLDVFGYFRPDNPIFDVGEHLPELLPDELREHSVGGEEYLWVLKGGAALGIRNLYETDASAIIKLLLQYALLTRQFLERYRLHTAPWLLGAEEPDSSGKGPLDPDEAVQLGLARLRLVDVSKTSWSQILEFRKDAEAKRRLRQVVHFFRQNYSGKDKSYIREDIEFKLAQYHDAVRDWGFETTISTISMLLSSKTLAGAAAAAIASAMFGSSSLALIAAAGGAAVEVGQLSLHVAKRVYGLKTLRRDHPLSYIIGAQRAFTKS